MRMNVKRRCVCWLTSQQGRKGSCGRKGLSSTQQGRKYQAWPPTLPPPSDLIAVLDRWKRSAILQSTSTNQHSHICQENHTEVVFTDTILVQGYHYRTSNKWGSDFNVSFHLKDGLHHCGTRREQSLQEVRSILSKLRVFSHPLHINFSEPNPLVADVQTGCRPPLPPAPTILPAARNPPPGTRWPTSWPTRSTRWASTARQWGRATTRSILDWSVSEIFWQNLTKWNCQLLCSLDNCNNCPSFKTPR